MTSLTRLLPSAARLRARSLCLVWAVVLAVTARAQLAWSVFDESAITPVASSGERVTVTVPAGQRVTLVATNIVPIDLTAATAPSVAISLTFTVSGGLTPLASGTRAVGFGLFNNNASGPNFTDDSGYFVWVNGRATGSLLEMRRRNGNGPSPSLLNPTGASFANLGTGSATQTAGALTDGVPYVLTLRLNRSAAGISLGTNTGTDVAGAWLRGDGLSQTAYTNPDTPPAATQFNELAFMFLNTTSAPVTLSLDSVAGVTAVSAPVITAQPQQLIVNPNQGGTLTVTATGTPPLAYQWRKDGIPIGGANNATYTLGAITAAEVGAYSVIVSNAYGSAISSLAPVIISTTPVAATIETHPASQTVNAGQTVTFAVNAFGSAPLTYEWQKNSVAISGANGPTLVLSGVTSADSGIYSVVVRNAVTAVVSNPATLLVNAPPTITAQPVSVTVNAGQAAQFAVTAAGTAPLTYQWLKDGAPVSGATSATLAFTNVSSANLGSYAVRVTNATGSIVSSPAVLTSPSTMTVVTRFPATGALVANPDSPLRLTFDRPVRAGVTGRVRILRASDSNVVDTLDLGANPTRLVGTNPTPYSFLPVIATGNSVTIYPRAGTLAYNQTYYVTMESGVVLEGNGASFTGITDPTVWRFTTKNAGPIPGTTAISVAADGTGDFATVQGAIDFVPAGNTARVVITVRRGTYNELNYIGSNKPFITVRGEDREQTIIAYSNNANFNGGNNRAMFSVDGNDFTLETITLRNTTPKGGSQAEAIRGNGQRGVLSRVNLSSYQDTLLWNGTLFVTDSFIEGDVDFMWGNGACYFHRCELKALSSGGYYAQIRNGQGQKGNVYVDCRLTAAEGVTGSYLARIDPRDGVANTWPYSQVVFLNCAMGPHIIREGWRLDNAATAPNVQFWEYKSTDADGASLDVSGRLRDAKQIDDVTAAQYRDPQFVVGFAPQILPTIEIAPAAQSALVGANVRLAVVANGSPVPVYQWLKDNVAMGGANDATLVLPNVQPADAGAYSVRVTNAGGAVTSVAATLTVTRGAFAGVYFGTIGGGGAFALFVRDNNSGVLLARGAGIVGAIASHTVTIDDGGRFRVTAGTAVIDASINAGSGIVTGTGPAGAVLAGTRSAGSGSTQGFAGYYTLRVAGGSLAVDAIVGSAGQAFAVVLEGTNDAGSGTVDATGQVNVTTAGGSTVTATLTGLSGTLRTPQGATTRVSPLSANNDAVAPVQRLTGLATRARASAGDGAAIVGFVISGDAPRPVLVRGVGPALAALGVSTAITAPKLDLFRGSTLLATNTGWSSGGNAASLTAAFASVGLFALPPGSADAALAVTLAPGAYTATITGVGGAAGNALVEIYDLAPTNLAQRISNLSTRAFAGRGEDTLIGGMIVAGAVPKRMLVRAVGPGLAQFGVGGALLRPSLTVFEGSRAVAQNSNWNTGPDAAAITVASAESGAFPLAPAAATANSDAALLLNLAPGNYTAQVTGSDGSTGVALLEIYELP